MVASACVVVWVVSGYETTVTQLGSTAAEYLGRYDLFLVPDTPRNAVVAPGLRAALRQDPAVAEIEPVTQTPARVLNPEAGGPMGEPGASRPEGKAEGKPPAGPGAFGGRRGRMGSPPALVGTDARQAPYTLTEGRWIDSRHGERREAVISNGLAQQLDVTVGAPILLIVGTKEYRLTVIGICAQIPAAAAAPTAGVGRRGSTAGPASAAVYVPLALASQLLRQPAQINLVQIKLKPGTDQAAFRTAWLPRLAAAQPPALLLSADDIRAEIEEAQATASARRQAWAATGISLLAAVFIIFTTLSMGVHERVRQLAILRAVGLTRGQVAGLVFGEGLLLALLGWGGGLAAGWGLLALASHAKPEAFPHGVSLGFWCVALSGMSAFCGTLLAAIIPAWQATRVAPLEAMTPRRRSPAAPGRLLLASLVGVLLVAVNPLLVFVTPISSAKQFAIFEAIGCVCMAVGFLLLAPVAIVAAEAVCAPLLGRLLGVDRRLLVAQLASNLGRTLGTTAALTIGLGLYVAIRIWGYSMLQPFLPGDWAPEAMVSFVSGLPDGEIEAVCHACGVRAGQCLPLAVEQPRLAGDITGSRRQTSITQQDNVVLVGLAPQLAFGGASPMLRVEFTQGDRAEVVARLRSGRSCVVPDYFARTTGLGVGDRFAMVPPEKPEQPVEYTIAGVASLPGSHMLTKMSGLRRRSGRMAALVFAERDTVRRDFALPTTQFFWFNVDPAANQESLRMALRLIADRNRDAFTPHGMQADAASPGGRPGQALRILRSVDVRANLQTRTEGILWLMSQIPLITLLVTSLGVVNTVLASVRARRWELGVLRAVGVTRWGLFAMILAEGLLIGLVACGLSLAFGVMAGWCGTGVSQHVSFFGGLNTPLLVPWSRLALGFGLTMALCLAAAVGPAIAVGRAEPLRLLQTGRATM
jgi:putative ABC transport system permease protein